MRIDRLYKWPIRVNTGVYTWKKIPRHNQASDDNPLTYFAWKHNTNITDLMTNCGGYVP